MNIDPDKADRSCNWKVEGTIDNEAQEFRDRLEILRANFDSNLLLKPVSLSLSDPDEHHVGVASFAAWTQTIDWNIPPKLKALAMRAERWRSYDELATWGQRQLWTLLEAAYVLAAEIPPAAPKYTIKFINTPLTDEDIQLEQLIGLAAEIYRELKDATDLKALAFVEPRTGGIGNRRVRPADCVAWAEGTGIEVPELFAKLKSGKTASSELHPKSLDSLLKLVITMAVKGYGHNPGTRSETAREISVDAEELGLRINEDTVRKLTCRSIFGPTYS